MASETTMANNIKVLMKTHVKPRKQLGRMEFELTIYDLTHLPVHYNKKLLVYKGFSCEFEDIVEKLKDGLAVVLDDFYLLAGKLRKDEDGYYKVVYDDDMRGVEVVATTANEIETDDLVDGKGLKELIPCHGLIGLDGLHQPLLAVQVTKLKDGLAMGCAFNHAILDGVSTWHFMSSWAEICSGSPTISVKPFLDRTNVQNRRIKLDLTPRPQTPQNDATLNAEMEPMNPRIDIKSQIFKFSESAIDRIKSNVNANQVEGSSNFKPFSTFQCFAAHVWRSVTRARQLDPEVKTVLGLVADCRKRVNPPMPKNYFGNIIQGISASTEAGLLLGNPPKFGAGMIRKAIEAHDSEAIDKYNMEWERNPRTHNNRKKLVNYVVFGGSPRFKAYEVDFGWGKPESVRSGGGDFRFDGLVHLYKGKSGGKSIDMDISLEGNAMKRLEKDKEFLMEADDDHVIDKEIRKVEGNAMRSYLRKDITKEFKMKDYGIPLRNMIKSSRYWRLMICITLRR